MFYTSDDPQFEKDEFTLDFEHSLCSKCEHKMSYIMEPYDINDISHELPDGALDGDVDDLVLEVHTCLISGDNLIGDVLKCNKFQPSKINYFLNNQSVYLA